MTGLYPQEAAPGATKKGPYGSLQRTTRKFRCGIGGSATQQARRGRPKILNLRTCGVGRGVVGRGRSAQASRNQTDGRGSAARLGYEGAPRLLDRSAGDRGEAEARHGTDRLQAGGSQYRSSMTSMSFRAITPLTIGPLSACKIHNRLSLTVSVSSEKMLGRSGI